ncbi:MAG: hypothetical protein M0Q54_09015 [Pigmentiphaga sp.]|nr:hypothetical protein [Pigmentiphaga sp.]
MTIDDVVYQLQQVKHNDELCMAACDVLDLLSLVNTIDPEQISILLESAGVIELINYLSDLYILFYKSDDTYFDIHTKVGRSAAIDYTIKQICRTYYERS